jgi:transcription elongation factor SPT6
MADLFDEAADVASGEEEEEELDDEGQPIRRSKNVDLNDSSEEEDDDDEEAAREVRDGFIVDEDEDDEEARQRKRERREERRKRRREEAEDDILDDEDLDLIGETHPDREGQQTQKSKYKRLKRGHREERQASEARGVEDIFSDDEDGGEGVGAARSRGAFGAPYGDEMDDFIEEDEFPDDEGERMREDLEIRQPSKGGFTNIENLKEQGLNEGDLEDMRGAFGDGNEFEWALDVEKDLIAKEEGPDRALELKDVFEPSQLVERMLTDEDNTIRITDVPERLQIARKPYKDLSELSEEQMAERMAEESKWIANTMFPQQQLPSSLREPFEQAVSKVLHFMNVEDFEPAFIFQNRKDYLIHSEQVPLPPDPSDPGAPAYEIKAEKLLSQTNLWELMDYDLKYRAFAEKRDGIRNSVEMLKEMFPDFNDSIFDDLMPDAIEIEDLQDLQDYLNFQYSQQLKDLSTVESEANGTQKRARGTRSIWDKVRAGNAYHLVRAFGITADAFAQNVAKIGRKNYTEDPDVRPDDMADTLVQEPEYRTGKEVLASARAMFVEEIASNPRLRKHLRKMYVEYMVFDAVRTDKGLKQIDAEHPYYEFKYLRNQGIRNFFSRPELFLRMLKAEQDGLIEIKVRLKNERRILDDLTKSIESDNFSEVADAWNTVRREIVGQAFGKLHRVIAKGWKDHMRNMCEGKIANECREAYSAKLDQAPYKPKGMVLGTTPRVLALSNGAGDRADAICWAYVDENGRVLENGKFTDMRLGNPEKYTSDGKDVAPFVELVERRKPDVVAVSGWSVETRRLYKDLQDIVERHSLQGTPYEDPDDDREVSDPLEIFMVNDEVARLYHTSARAAVDHPSVPPLTRYSIALAMYMQNPMKEYASLGRDITSITFDPSQHLIPEDKLMKALDSAMVDMVNLVGIDINDAVNDSSTARLLPYISGLGPRKAAQMLKTINSWGGEVNTRDQLVGDLERGWKPSVGPKIWVNCASFLYIVYEATENDTDYLDNTRIHPEDYDIARKIAADALEFDEEDIKNEVDQNGVAAVVRRLVADDAQDKVNDLLLENYAGQLETKFGQKKRATLELIRAELQNPFEELRRNFEYLSSNEAFTMMTGETSTSLQEGMIIPVSVKRTSSDHIEVKLDCGVDGNISSSEFPDEVTNNGLEPRQVWPIHQIVRAKITHIDRKKLHAQLTMRDGEMKNPFRRQMDHDYGKPSNNIDTSSQQILTYIT